jgi:hypothetical protein
LSLTVKNLGGTVQVFIKEDEDNDISVVAGGWSMADSQNPAITLFCGAAIADYGRKICHIGQYLPYQRGLNPSPLSAMADIR